MFNIAEIDKKLRTVCPIDGVNSNGIISFGQEATEEQKAAATEILQKLIANDSILKQIQELEDTITERRRDEAILGQDNGWLKNIRGQISALRATLSV